MSTTRRDLAEAAWGNLLRVHARVVPVLDAELRARHGLPVNFYDVLLVLRRAPEGRLTITDLSSGVMLSRSRVSRLVDDMVAAGLVAREDNPDDRRSALATLTPAGRDLQRTAAPTLLRLLQDQVAATFDEDELRTLATLLERIASPPATT